MKARLGTVIEQAGVGEFDGDEFGGGAVTMYSYGPDADALFAAAEETLRSLAFRPAVAVLRYGDAADMEAREVRITL
ncbi:hypothetical protein [Actinoallomurus sp. NPDC052274]|uniref:hypothetical protein n=1 Tax=unclassified Actinoallomurus TaxID=2624323 RepID=UPI0034305C6D